MWLCCIIFYQYNVVDRFEYYSNNYCNIRPNGRFFRVPKNVNLGNIECLKKNLKDFPLFENILFGLFEKSDYLVATKGIFIIVCFFNLGEKSLKIAKVLVEKVSSTNTRKKMQFSTIYK